MRESPFSYTLTLLRVSNPKEGDRMRDEHLIDSVYGDYIILDGVYWKKIDAFPSYYVNEEGDVASTIKGYFHILSYWTNQYGHYFVQLRNEAGKKKMLVHRIVAEAFIPNPNHLPIVRHLDDDPTNNEVSNLAWGTPFDNMQDCIRHGRNFVKPVYCYETDRVYKSCAEAAIDLSVAKSLITVCCQGKIHSVRGCHFCYLSDKEAKMKDMAWLSRSGNFKPLKARNPSTGETLYFKSRMEASETLGIPNCGISSVITGHLKHTHGWTFEDTMEVKHGNHQ